MNAKLKTMSASVAAVTRKSRAAWMPTSTAIRATITGGRLKIGAREDSAGGVGSVMGARDYRTERENKAKRRARPRVCPPLISTSRFEPPAAARHPSRRTPRATARNRKARPRVRLTLIPVNDGAFARGIAFAPRPNGTLSAKSLVCRGLAARFVPILNGKTGPILCPADARTGPTAHETRDFTRIVRILGSRPPRGKGSPPQRDRAERPPPHPRRHLHPRSGRPREIRGPAGGHAHLRSLLPGTEGHELSRPLREGRPRSRGDPRHRRGGRRSRRGADGRGNQRPPEEPFLRTADASA